MNGLQLLLIALLIIFAAGSLPTWGWGWGYTPSGSFGLILVILIVLILFGRI